MGKQGQVEDLGTELRLDIYYQLVLGKELFQDKSPTEGIVLGLKVDK
jgi:hypothetical protein